MAGGVGEGAIPLSIGYAEILHQPQGELFAQVLPPVMLGSLTAILLRGRAQLWSARDIRISPAKGACSPASMTSSSSRRTTHEAMSTSRTIAAAGVTAITLYLVGVAGRSGCSACRRRWRCCSRGAAEARARRVAVAAARRVSSSTSSSRRR